MRRTLLVLGAGASYDYGFPTGIGLRDLIVYGNDQGPVKKALELDEEPEDRDPKRLPALYDQIGIRHHLPEHHMRSFANKFHDSEVPSIDAFLREYEEFRSVGCVVISAIILECERVSKLKGGWYRDLWSKIAQDGSESSASWLSIINFNYDRSLEQYLKTAAPSAFPKTGSDLIKQIRHRHVYGSLGQLDGDGPIPYGGVDFMEGASKNIDLMRPVNRAPDWITDWMQEAEQIVFVGFGFDSINLNALALSHNFLAKKQVVYASCLGLSVSNKMHASQRISPATIHWGEPSKFLHDTPWAV